MKRIFERIIFVFIGILIACCIYFATSDINAQGKEQLKPIEQLLFNLDMFIAISHLDNDIIKCKIDVLDNYIRYEFADDANERNEYLNSGFEYDKKLIYLSAVQESLIGDYEPIKILDNHVKTVSETLEREFNKRINNKRYTGPKKEIRKIGD